MKTIKSLPLIFDHHAHLSFYAMLCDCLNVGGCYSSQELLGTLRSLPADQLNIITGWHSERITLSKEILSGYAPVVIINFCLHGFICNEEAACVLRANGINPYPADSLEAERETAKIFTFFPEYAKQRQNEQELTDIFKRYTELMQKEGLYGLEDMMYTLPQAFPQELFPDFQVITRRYYRASNDKTPAGNFGNLTAQPSRERLKLFCDGAIGARTAAIGKPYSGGGHPTLIYQDDELEPILQDCIAREADLAIHAIGEAAISQVLRIYKHCLPLPVGNRFSLRLEHCQFITLEQAQRAKQLGLTLSMQPNFNDDSQKYRDRLPIEYCQGNNPFRMLIDQAGFVPGQDLLFGSDGMPAGLAQALQNSLFPAYPGQALTVEELLAGYTADPRKGTRDYEIDDVSKTVRLVC